MPTLYVENVPADLYAALRKRAKQNSSSIAAEVISLLKRHVPTAAELRKRRKFFEYVVKLQKETPPGPGPFPSAEEMIREDRER